MIERIYRCDLCHDTYGWNSGDLFGLYWEGKKLLVRSETRELEHHICRACFGAIAHSGGMLAAGAAS
jgi:hypothetical protein